jgi:hypothetical protein
MSTTKNGKTLIAAGGGNGAINAGREDKSGESEMIS